MKRIEELVKGHNDFKKNKFHLFEDEIKRTIIHGQRPKVMFIGCSDSRVTPDLMLGTSPGDMFIFRNVGNFVAPYKKDEDYHGGAAAIEYAVSVLNVSEIIVCGHSHCGACKSLYDEIPKDDELIHVRTWLKLGQKAKQRTLENGDFKTEEQMFRATERNSIRHQLENLLTYPEVFKRVAQNRLKIHGWYYDIETGSIDFYEKETDSFKPIEELLK